MVHKNTQPAMTAVLLMLALSALACSIPIGGGATTPTPLPPPTTAPALTLAPPATAVAPTLPTATDQPPIVPETGEVLIYMVALEDNGASGQQIGCGDSLIPVRRTIEPTDQPLVAALNTLFSVKAQYYGESGLYNALYQSSLAVTSASVDAAGAAAVSISGQVQLGGTCDVPRFQEQIEQTVLSIGGVTAANILLNGQPIDEALSQR